MSTAPDSAIASGSIAVKGDGNTGGASARELPQKSWARIVWEFSRPHTIIGSVLSIVSLHLFAATAPGAAVINISALGVALAWALVCGVLINIYVTGLNQIFDVEIDKINKPYLPIAAGHLSIPAAWAVCLGSLLLGTLPSIIAYPFDKAPLLGTFQAHHTFHQHYNASLIARFLDITAYKHSVCRAPLGSNHTPAHVTCGEYVECLKYLVSVKVSRWGRRC